MPLSSIASLSYAARRAVWLLLCRHRPGPDPPILILTSRRSGGTWLSDALSAERGLLSVLQPFAIGLSDPFLRFEGSFLESVRANGRTPIRPDDERPMRAFVEQMLRGRLKIGWPANPFSRRFQWRTGRILVKMHNTKAWIDWFEEEFPEARIVFHLRHPIPQAFSAMRMGWPDRTEAYLRDRSFVEAHLSTELESIAREFLAGGSPFERAILGWIVENRAPLRLLEGRRPRRWLTTTYEETAANPQAVFERLITHLGLRCGDAVLERALLPSHTVFDSSKRQLIEQAAGGGEARSRIIDGWLKRVSQEQIAQAARLLDAFGVSCYRPDSPYPSSNLWLSPDSFQMEERTSAAAQTADNAKF